MIKTPNKKYILVSFSGGETSAYMIYWLLKNKPNENYLFVFANTDEENEETLVFAKQVQDYFNIDLIWVEYEHLSFKVVDFETAYRSHNPIEIKNKWQNHPFRKYISEYMIPNRQNMTCTRELKENVIRRYLSSKGITKRFYDIAIGIRADEIDRLGKHYYPLAQAGITKNDVHKFWEKMPFRLQLDEHQGNCKVCWKKSFRKLATLYKENPKQFDFFKQMEKEYGEFIRPTQAHRLKVPMHFFRDNKTVNDIKELSEQTNFVPFKDFKKYNRQTSLFDYLDESNGCTESCEVFV